MTSINSRSPKIPNIVAGAVDMDTHLVVPYSPSGSLVSLSAPGAGLCTWGSELHIATGVSTATAIITGLAADILSRSKIRGWIYLDHPDLAPDNERKLANRPLTAKIRDYLDHNSYDRLDPAEKIVGGVKSIWNGLWPDNPKLYQP